MRRGDGAILVSTLLVLWPWMLMAQTPKPPSLKEQLEAQYQQPGTVLVIQKEGILGVAATSKTPCATRYQGGKLNPDASCPASKPLTRGEKVNLLKIEVDEAKGKISFRIGECDACNKVGFSSRTSQINFQFADLKQASISEIEDTIGEVLAFQEVVERQPPQPPTPPEQPGVLTNSDIFKLAKVKLRDDIVISKIKSSPCSFDTSVDALVKLKEAGVSDPVIQAMQEATVPPLPPLDVTGQWTATSTNSKSNGPVAVRVDLEQHPDGSVTGSTLLNGTVIEKGVGTVQGDTLNYTSTRIITSCPGTFTGTVTFAGDTGSGHYEGRDCSGPIQDGTISMSRAQEVPPTPGGAGPEAAFHDGKPALVFRADQDRTFAVDLLDHDGERTLRLRVHHSHMSPCTGYMYISHNRISYDPVDTPKFQKDAFVLQRSEIKKAAVAREALTQQYLVAIWTEKKRYLFYLLFDPGPGSKSGVQGTRQDTVRAEAVYEFIGRSLNDFDSVLHEAETQTASLARRP